jgi:serine/threonine protein kinase
MLCTQEGQILGTVSYMSPEQAEGRVVDARSDMFSFGCVMYEMITARRAFDGESNLSTLADILRTSPKPVRELVPAASRELEQVIDKCLEKNPAQRFGSMREVKAALGAQLRIESGRLLHWRKQRWKAVVKSALALLAVFALMWWASSHVKVADHYCPVKSRIESVVCNHRANTLGSQMLPRPVKWAVFQKV